MNRRNAGYEIFANDYERLLITEMDNKEKSLVYCIGNTHFDPVWLWTWDEALASIRSTFRSALDRMNEYPEYTYSFCTPAVFEMIEKVDPELFAEIRARALEGRWDMSEGWWLQPDCGLALGESYVRQGLYGQRYIEEKFGKRSNVMFNIDSFGHSDMLPQIMRGCGIDSYVFSRPESYHVELPDSLFLWTSPDGSSVMAYRAADLYQHTPEEVLKSLDKYIGETETADTDRMIVYGITNHGGAPTKAILSALNGEMKKGRAARFSSLEEFFNAQRAKYKNVPGSAADANGRELPEVTGGINTRDCGVFSNYSWIKSDNRRAEYTALAAERAAIMACSLGEEYPLDGLRSVWHDVMYNQFHDILGGASIMQAYRDARDLHGRAIQNASEIMNFSMQKITRRVTTGDGFWNYIYFNFNLEPYHGELEAELQWAWEYDLYKGAIEVTDKDGNEIPCQIIRERSTIPGFRTRVAFVGEIPPLGYAVYHFKQKDGDGTHVIGGEASVVSTERFEVETLLSDGGVCVKDKLTGAELVISPEVRKDTGDVWSFNACGYGEKLEDFTPCGAACTERGDIITKVRTRSKFRDSKLEQHITVYPGENYIDLRFRADWDEPHTVLKYRIFEKTPANKPSSVCAGVPGGETVRAYDGLEYPLSETIAFDRFTVASGNIFAYDTDKENATIGLTVLRNPVCGDLRMDEDLNENEDYLYVGRGVTEGTLRIWFSDSGENATAHRENTSAFLFAPFSVCEARHGGTLPMSASYIEWIGDSKVNLDAIKQAEDGSGDMIVRISNRSGETVSGKLCVPYKSEYSNDIVLGPWKIVTLRFKGILDLSDFKVVNMLEE